MKAFVLHSYGSPDVLELTDVDKPVPADDEVLVRVRADLRQPLDWHHMRGEPYIARLMAAPRAAQAEAAASWAPTWRDRSRRSART